MCYLTVQQSHSWQQHRTMTLPSHANTQQIIEIRRVLYRALSMSLTNMPLDRALQILYGVRFSACQSAARPMLDKYSHGACNLIQSAL